MSRLVYACKFDLDGPRSWGLVTHAYQSWIEHHYRERRGVKNFNIDVETGMISGSIPADHKIDFESFEAEKNRVIRIGWGYPVDGDVGLEWRNEIRIGKFQGVCSVEHLISVGSVEYSIRPLQFILGSPGVIRQLCTDNSVKIGDMVVKATPYPLGIASINLSNC
jgi:hypothetical protein